MSRVPRSGVEREDYLLFSESQSRFVVTVDPKRKQEFERLFEGLVFAEVGRVVDSERFVVKGLGGNNSIDCNVDKLEEFYKGTFKDY